MATASDVRAFLTTKEAAAFLGIHVNSVYRLVNAGVLVPALPGFGKILFAREAIENLAKAPVSEE